MGSSIVESIDEGVLIEEARAGGLTIDEQGLLIGEVRTGEDRWIDD